MTRFLQKNGGLNRWAITGVLLKTRVKNVIKKDTTENKKKQESINKSSKNDVLKTSKSQRYSDYSGFVKSRVGSRTFHSESRESKNQFFDGKWCS